MRSYRTKNFRSDLPCVVALGCFDGVHIGHAKVISEAVRISKATSSKSAVWTFDEPPRNFFSAGTSPIITDYSEKQRLMRSLGIDLFISVPFDADIGDLAPTDFFEEILIDRMNAIHIVCGYNYHFGKGGTGNTELLENLCRKRGIGFTCLPPVKIDNIPISSSQIRDAVESRNVELAKTYLGRPFAIDTIVIDGQKLARRLGFPTVNQVFKRGILVPGNGVYVTRVSFDSKKYYGITNVGTRPTVGGSLLCAETHIFKFNGNLYGKRVRVEFLHFLRPEITFSSVDALADQVAKDISAAKELIDIKI